MIVFAKGHTSNPGWEVPEANVLTTELSRPTNVSSISYSAIAHTTTISWRSLEAVCKLLKKIMKFSPQ